MGDAFVYAPVSTLIGVIVLIGCIYAFGWWGLISLIFILPMIKKDAIKMKQKMKDDEETKNM